MAPPRTAVQRPPAARPAVLRRAAVVLVGALGAALLPGAAAAEPGTAQDAAALVAARGHDLEVVTEEFNEARELLRAEQAAAEAAAGQVAEAQAAADLARAQVRGIARSAFTGDSQGSLQALLTSDSATEFVDRVTLLETVAGHHGAVLGEAVAAGQAAETARRAAEDAAARAQATYEAVVTRQAGLEAEIAAYQADFARLSEEERRAAIELAAAHHGAQDEGADAEVAGREDGGERASRTERDAAAPAAPVVADSRAAQVAVDTAMAQRGKPYVWAAAGPGSYDCSGLTQYAFRAAGIGLPHSSRMQAQLGAPVSRADLRPGDLVFFYRPVSHVGIYIGNGQMVHAPTSGDVVKVTGVDSMGGFSGARRIAG